MTLQRQNNGKTLEIRFCCSSIMLLQTPNINVATDSKHRGKDYWVENNNIVEALERSAGWEISSGTVRESLDYLVGHNYVNEIVRFEDGEGRYKITPYGIDKAEGIRRELPQRHKQGILNYVYDLAITQNGGIENTWVTSDAISSALGVSKMVSESILQLLASEKLVQEANPTSWPRSYRSYKLTHAGVKAVSESPESKLALPTTTVINWTGNNQGQLSIQTAQDAAAAFYQHTSPDWGSVLELIRDLKSSLISVPEPEREDTSNALEVLQEEISAKEKHSRRIRAVFNGLYKGFTGVLDTGTKGSTFAIKLIDLQNKLRDLGILDKAL